MTDLTISVPDETAQRLQREASVRGVSVETIAAEMIATFCVGDELDVEEDLRRLAEPGEDIDAATAFAEFRRHIEEARRNKS